MNKRSELVRDFAHTYFHINLGALARVPREIHTQVVNVQTIVVDTVHLTDGSQILVDTWTLPGTAARPDQTAHLATIASLQPLPRGLRRATTSSQEAIKPAYSGVSDVEWSAWHHGEEYELTIAGSIEETLPYCDLSDTEHEQVIMQARRLSHGGHIVYATAKGFSKDTIPMRGTLKFDGLVACKLELLPGTLHAISTLRARGIKLVYMSSGPEDVATFVAHAARITEHPKIARHGRYATSDGHTIYARVTRINARNIIAALPQPVLVSHHPIATLVDMLDACR